uniref:Dmt106 n=1 Tax=Arundo donax TaxID=35708 RepID=A0A0A9FBX3_ARUDO
MMLHRPTMQLMMICRSEISPNGQHRTMSAINGLQLQPSHS